MAKSVLFYSLGEDVTNEIKVHINQYDKIYIEAGELESESPYYKGYVTLDKETALEFAKNIIKLCKSLENG